MREHPGRARLAARQPNVVLPADGATLATSLSRGLMLVAHTGNAHLGVTVDRALLRHLARARAAAPARSSAPAMNDERVARTDLPEAIPFRHATSHSFGVSGDEIHLALRATGDPSKPDVQVELRMDKPLIERLAQHHDPSRQGVIAFALAGLLILAGAFVATLAIVA